MHRVIPPNCARWEDRSTESTGTECGLSDRKGRIAHGYDADILAIDGDPLTDPAALHNIRDVWVRGTRVQR